MVEAMKGSGSGIRHRAHPDLRVGTSSLSARYAVCEGVLRQGSLAADAALATAAGFAAMGVDHAAVDAVGAEEAARILDGEGLHVSSYMGLDDILLPDGGVSPLDGLTRRLDLAARVGAPAALVATGPLGSRPLREADSICHDWLTDAARVAGERSVRIMLEPMHPLMRRWSYVHTLRDGLALTEGLEGVGVVLDLGHVWWEHGLDTLIREHVDAIESVQVTNVDSDALAEIRYERAPLDVGDVPVAFLVGLLESSGYRGWYENEVRARTPRNERLGMLRSSREWFEGLSP
jgi:sugar phosphate isomerase/epimerase